MTTIHEPCTTTRRAHALRPAATALCAAVLAAAAAVEWTPADARASVPESAPTFTAPTEFTNPFFPFEAGAVKVFRGRSEGKPVTDLDLYLAGTRDFQVGGATVTCRILQEYAFEKGELVEISRNHFAQADDGTVYYFGETVDNYEDGVVVDHGGSWLVGGPAADDPEETETVAAPAVFMPANPEVGDQFLPEDLAGGNQEIDTIRRVGRKVKVPVGRLQGCIEVREYSPLTDETETKWYAPGIGVTKAKARGELSVLDSTTLD